MTSGHITQARAEWKFEKAVKLSVYTVPEVWYKARKSLLIDGGPYWKAKASGLIKNKMKFMMTPMLVLSSSLANQSESEQIRWIIKMIAEHCSEIAVLESIEPVLISESSTKGSMAKVDQAIRTQKDCFCCQGGHRHVHI